MAFKKGPDWGGYQRVTRWQHCGCGLSRAFWLHEQPLSWVSLHWKGASSTRFFLDSLKLGYALGTIWSRRGFSRFPHILSGCLVLAYVLSCATPEKRQSVFQFLYSPS